MKYLFFKGDKWKQLPLKLMNQFLINFNGYLAIFQKI
jgi:hypothetical protein